MGTSSWRPTKSSRFYGRCDWPDRGRRGMVRNDGPIVPALLACLLLVFVGPVRAQERSDPDRLAHLAHLGAPEPPGKACPINLAAALQLANAQAIDIQVATE